MNIKKMNPNVDHINFLRTKNCFKKSKLFSNSQHKVESTYSHFLK